MKKQDVILKTIIAFFMLNLVLSCSKNNAERKTTDLKGFEKIQSEDPVLQNLNISEYFYKRDINGFTIVLKNHDNNEAVIKQENITENYITEILYKDNKENFRILSKEREHVMEVSEGGKLIVDLIYDSVNRVFINKVVGREFTSNWIEKSKIDPIKYLILGAIVDEVTNKLKIYKNPIDKVRDKGSNVSINKTTIIKKRYSSETMNVLQPCAAICRSDMVWGQSTMACYQAQQGNTGGCCTSGYCLGCCSHIGCDCAHLIGDYLGWCVAVSKACSGPGQAP